MSENSKQTAKAALDALALALTELGHTWTPRQRQAYERAIRLLS